MRKIKKIHIHHTQSPISMFNGSNHENLKRLVWRWHVIERRFQNIGYHYLIFPDGKILDCRPLLLKPASIAWHNKYALALCLWGDFDTDPIQQKQYSQLISTVSEYLDLFKLKITDIIFHRELNPKKSCPGKNIVKADFIDNLITFRQMFGHS